MGLRRLECVEIEEVDEGKDWQEGKYIFIFFYFYCYFLI
jgi:hypothetical protein